jgi:hypothetical protein
MPMLENGSEYSSRLGVDKNKALAAKSIELVWRKL